MDTDFDGFTANFQFFVQTNDFNFGNFSRFAIGRSFTNTGRSCLGSFALSQFSKVAVYNGLGVTLGYDFAIVQEYRRRTVFAYGSQVMTDKYHSFFVFLEFAKIIVAFFLEGGVADRQDF